MFLGDLVFDKFGNIGIVSSASDNSGDYVVTKISQLSIDYNALKNLPTYEGTQLKGEVSEIIDFAPIPNEVIDVLF